MNIKYFMKKALEQANKALLADEIPIGAVLVDNNNNKIISESYNLINANILFSKNPVKRNNVKSTTNFFSGNKNQNLKKLQENINCIFLYILSFLIASLPFLINMNFASAYFLERNGLIIFDYEKKSLSFGFHLPSRVWNHSVFHS